MYTIQVLTTAFGCWPGILDTFMNPKPGVAPYIKQFNARSIFLQDGLQLSYQSGDHLSVDISLSNL